MLKQVASAAWQVAIMIMIWFTIWLLVTGAVQSVSNLINSPNAWR